MSSTSYHLNLPFVHSYGFCLEDNNFASYKFRVVLSTAPDGEIEDPEELLPTQKVLDDWENIETTTETIVLKSHRLCMELLKYLRSVMGNHYKENNGPDFEYLMVSCPRVLPFELFITEWAINLLEKVGEKQLFNRTSLD